MPHCSILIPFKFQPYYSHAKNLYAIIPVAKLNSKTPSTLYPINSMQYFTQISQIKFSPYCSAEFNPIPHYNRDNAMRSYPSAILRLLCRFNSLPFYPYADSQISRFKLQLIILFEDIQIHTKLSPGRKYTE